jgi:hypothetical protein
LAKSSGCPKLAGAYAWPPVEGAPQGYKEGGGLENYRAVPEFFGLTLGNQSTLTVQDGDEATKKRLRIESRVTSPPMQAALRHSSREFRDNQYRCKDGWVVTAEYGGDMSVGAKLATLANGDLVVGQWMRKDGGKDCLFPWGGSCGGGEWIPAADKVTWYWSRYRRVGA